MRFSFTDRQITVNVPDSAALLETVRSKFRIGHGFALATINLDHLVKLRSSASYRAAYAAHDLVVADGNPIVWLSRIARRPVSLVPGSDILHPILRVAAQENVPVAFFGSTNEVLTEAAHRLCHEIDGLQVVWTQSPPMGFDPAGEAARLALLSMKSSGARLCIISLSAPRQEGFAALGREIAPDIGFCSFGAGLDFVAGEQIRAPVWMRKLALEWLWRVFLSPRRLVPRYAACIAILPAHALDALRQRQDD